MTSPKLSHQIPDPNNPNDPDGIGRMYGRYPGAEPEVPSITTIIDVLNSKMEWWRGLCAGKEAVKVANLIVERQNNLSDYEWRSKEKEIVKWIDEAAVRDMNISSQRGDLVHDYAEKVCRKMLGEDFNLDDEREIAHESMKTLYKKNSLPTQDLHGYFNSVHQFLEDFDVKPVRAEGTVWNSTVGYAGTNDLLCRINNRLILLDWKTKKKIKDPQSRWYRPSIQETISLQLEASQRGEEVYSEVTDEWEEWEGQNAEGQMGVALGPNGYEAIKVIRKEDTWETFKALRVAWDWNTPENNHIIARPCTPADLFTD